MGENGHRHSGSKMTLAETLDVLRNEGLRITRPRRAILEILLKLEKPVTIEEIHQKLETRLCDLVTVYRCLATFEKLSLVRRSLSHDGTSLYQIDLGPDHQHHIVCTSCKKVESLDFCVVEGLERVVRERGYQNVSHMLEFFGVCSACSGA